MTRIFPAKRQNSTTIHTTQNTKQLCCIVISDKADALSDAQPMSNHDGINYHLL